MSVINTQPLAGSSGQATGYNIERSLRLRSSASAYLSRTPASAGNQKTYTISMWIKRGTLGAIGFVFGAGSSGTDRMFMDISDNTDDIAVKVVISSVAVLELITTQVFRDPSAWYHIVLAIDTTQATASNRAKLYVNGNQITSFATATYPTQNTNTYINSTVAHAIGCRSYAVSNTFDGYLAETNFIDGQALTPSSFGETDTITGVWKPKRYAGTYGTNGFYLPFTDVATTSGSNAGLGKDFSGNGNYWTTNNISVTAGATYDSMTDVPTLTSATTANYCIVNPLRSGKASGTSAGAISAGNLNIAMTSTGTGYYDAFGSIAVNTGKWYWETTITSAPATTNVGIQLDTASSYLPTGGIGADAYGWSYYSGNYYTNNTNSGSPATFTTGDVIGVALDMTNGKIYFSKNNTWQSSGDPVAGTNPAFSGLSGNMMPAWSLNSNPTAGNVDVNLGQRPFAYTPPSGFKALNTYNLPDSTIVAGNKYMDATTYAGTATTQSITNAANFKPDFVWIKNRTIAGQSHVLQDSVRGTYKYLVSDGTQAENTNTGYDWFKSFDANGFTVAYTSSNSTTASNWNASGSNYVGWQWQAGQGSTSSNTSGSITSTVSVNASAGFSIVTYIGTGANATVGHGLGVAPKFYVVKNRTDATTNWYVYNASSGQGNYLLLNTSDAASASTTVWNNTAPTSSVFSLGASASNTSTKNYVAYCWAEIAGFSKFGSYTGNGSANGPFVYCGFRPRYVMIKCSSAAGLSWVIFDSQRNTYNSSATAGLWANETSAEANYSPIDFLSNGFKIRETSSTVNGNGNTYIYSCFAENPFKNSLAR